MLFDSIVNISVSKNLRDQHQFEIDQLQSHIKSLQSEKTDQEQLLGKSIRERDVYRDDLKEVVDLKKKLENKSNFDNKQLREEIQRLHQEIKKLTENLDKAIDDYVNAQKTLKTMVSEREKMKVRINKLKNRKGKVDQGIKMCRNCGKEFHEKENFHWSCRTHRSDYGGEMWWCCGK